MPAPTYAFIAKWAASGTAERANVQLFVADRCALIGVEAPQPKTPDEHANAYVFEKTIPGPNGAGNFIDCYKRGCFVDYFCASTVMSWLRKTTKTH
jgi:hypothetical protein